MATNYSNIFEAAAKGTVEDVKYFVERGTDVETTGDNGWTALHHAALNCHPGGGIECYAPKILEYLVSKGADVNAKTDTGLTPLHLAAMDNPRREVLTCLIDLGADLRASSATECVPPTMPRFRKMFPVRNKNNTNCEMVYYFSDTFSFTTSINRLNNSCDVFDSCSLWLYRS